MWPKKEENRLKVRGNSAFGLEAGVVIQVGNHSGIEGGTETEQDPVRLLGTQAFLAPVFLLVGNRIQPP